MLEEKNRKSQDQISNVKGYKEENTTIDYHIALLIIS